ncbi:cardiolipin synthase [Salisediminibacterium selenitireducens]|uniref:Cardiolipin synthase n=1 Tax=Bacillus selenitireducens (strain ATCC 700615 / DSM 15326 / MLS10) TaxID=439292 RepID=D6XUI9_BACIE|nr:cardiolipin synthase [Salisediminibacterium selenitireducens]ADH99475.1 phospholipase D/Transphosphatidylase [[Bacillus] selenitireducens MLS10]
MDWYSVVVIILFFFNFTFAGLIIFIERKDATATWAWLMILFLVPYVGLILYIFLGQNLTRRRLFNWEGVQKVGIVDRISEQMIQLRDKSFSFNNNTVDRYRDLIYMHLVNNDAVLTKGNAIDIFHDGQDKFDQLIDDIRAANHHIHLQYYIFRNDELGKKIIYELTEKAKQGVSVRVLYDELGSRKLRRKHFKSLADAGGKIGVFFPSKVSLINIRLNYRNHRKLVIIDGEIGYVGGFNIGDEYLGKSEKFGYWRDTHLRIRGEAVDPMQTRFILDWNQASKSEPIQYDPAYFPDKDHLGNAAIQMVSSGPDSPYEQIKNGYIKLIFEAEESIYIQTPYFIPDKSLLDAVQIASLSGKDVRVMIPNKPDHPFVYWATYSHIGQILETGARVFIYEGGFIHSKNVVIDGKICSVGTANIDMRSFKLNFEINAFIYDIETSGRVVSDFMEDMNHSVELTLAMYKRRSKYIRFKESISRLLSPVL